MIADQTTIFTYKLYVETSVKKDAVRQRNKLVSRVVAEIMNDVVEEATCEYIQDRPPPPTPTELPKEDERPTSSVMTEKLNM